MAFNPKVSIIDFLESKGQDSSFEARKGLFTQFGLDKDLGEFVGSSEQNTQLLKLLEQQDASAQTQKDPVQDFVEQQTNQNAVPQQFKDLIPPAPELPTPEEILELAQESTDFQFAQKASEQAKSLLEQTTEAQKQKTTATLQQEAAAKGVAFSPAFAEKPVEEAIALLDAEKVSKDLNIDLGLAEILSNQVNKISKEFEKDTEQQQKEIKDFLKTQGLIFNPLTGEVEFTKQEKEEQEELQAAAESIDSFAQAVAKGDLDLSAALTKLPSTMHQNLLDKVEGLGGVPKKQPKVKEPKIMSVTKFNVSAGIAGLTDEQAVDVFTESTPPKWFVDQLSQQKGQSLLPEFIQEQWTLKQLQANDALIGDTEDPFDTLLKELTSELEGAL